MLACEPHRRGLHHVAREYRRRARRRRRNNQREIVLLLLADARVSCGVTDNRPEISNWLSQEFVLRYFVAVQKRFRAHTLLACRLHFQQFERCPLPTACKQTALRRSKRARQ